MPMSKSTPAKHSVKTSDVTKTRNAIVRYIQRYAKYFRAEEESQMKWGKFDDARFSRENARVLELVAQKIKDGLYIKKTKIQ